MEKSNSSFHMEINGTNFIVNMKQADNAKLTFEELVKEIISNEAEALEDDESG